MLHGPAFYRSAVHLLLLAGLLMAALGGTGRAVRADAAVVVHADTVTTVGGFGVFPASYDRVMPVYPGGTPAYEQGTWLPAKGPLTGGATLTALRGLGCEIGRVYLTPTLGRADHTLDPARLQDLEDHLASLRNAGIRQYVLTVWSPPPYMKLPDHVRYGVYQGRNQFLDPDCARPDRYGLADYYVAVLSALKRAGEVAPLCVSLQNEPGIGPGYDGCVYTDNAAEVQTWRRAVVLLRRRLDARHDPWFAGIRIIGPEAEGWEGMTALLGAASERGFAALNADPALAGALGGLAYHSYYTSARIKTLDRALAASPGRGRWMTEYSTAVGVRGPLHSDSGNQEMDWALNDVRRMAGDLVDLHTGDWFFWRFWHPSSAADDQDLVYGDGKKSKAYFAFQSLWTRVRGGWKVKRTTSTDPDLRADNRALIDGPEPNGNMMSLPIDVISFEGPRADRTVVLLANWTGRDKAVTTLAGLHGGAADVFVTSASQDGARTETRPLNSGTLQGGPLTLLAGSITLVVSRPASEGRAGQGAGAVSGARRHQAEDAGHVPPLGEGPQGAGHPGGVGGGGG